MVRGGGETPGASREGQFSLAEIGGVRHTGTYWYIVYCSITLIFRFDSSGRRPCSFFLPMIK